MAAIVVVHSLAKFRGLRGVIWSEKGAEISLRA